MVPVNATVTGTPSSTDDPAGDPGAGPAGAPAEVPALLAGAVDLARASVVEGLEPGSDPQVGEHRSVTAEPGGAATHRFAAALPGYRGWEWAVTVAATPDATEPGQVTVSEVVLLPTVAGYSSSNLIAAANLTHSARS